MEELSSELSEFSKWLRVPNDEIWRARRLGHKIFSWIKEESKFKTDRIRFGGSFAKRTATLLKLDVDVAIYVNYEKDLTAATPPEEIMRFFDDVKNDWKDILIRNTNLTQEDLSKGKNAVKFDLEGLQFDLCPAINYSQDQHDQIISNKLYQLTNNLRKRIIEIPKNIIKKIESLSGKETNDTIIAPKKKIGIYKNKFMPELSAALSPSFSEAAVQFVVQQSDYVKDLCRLTKFWQQSVPYFQFISGRSFLFECIAIR